jgi:threonine dehydrogenase-like Zn-dependent dehydrogenase
VNAQLEASCEPSFTTARARRPGKRYPDPEIADDGDIIVRVDAVTICGTDLHILKGDVPEVRPGRILGLRENRVSAFPVINDQHKVIGIVSEADMLTKEALIDEPEGLPAVITGILHRRDQERPAG